MKKISFLAIAIGMLGFTACNNNKTSEPIATHVETIKDSALQVAAAGEYISYDGSTVITLGSDFSVKVKNFNKDYYKWEFMVVPDGQKVVNIYLNRKGLDADVQDQALLNTEDGSLTIKNETFRKKSAGQDKQ